MDNASLLFIQKNILELKEMIIRNQSELDRIGNLITDRFSPDLPYLTRTQAATVLKCSTTVVDSLCRSGTLRKTSTGKVYNEDIINYKNRTK